MINHLSKRWLSALLLGTVAAAGSGYVAHAATCKQTNVYAYDVRVNSTEPLKPLVSFYLNGQASTAVVHAYVGGVEVDAKTITFTTSDDANNKVENVALTIPKDATGQVTFKVVANTRTTVSTPKNVTYGSKMTTTRGTETKTWYGRGFNVPMGVTVNNCTESPAFGQVVVTEFAAPSEYKSKENGTRFMSATNPADPATNSPGVGAGLYPHTPQMTTNSQTINGQKTLGFQSNIDPTPIGAFNRPRFAPDGRIFMYTYDAAEGCGIYEFAQSTTATSAANFKKAATKVLSLEKPAIKSSLTHSSAGAPFGFFGKGDALKMAVALPKETWTQTPTAVSNQVSAFIYDLSANTTCDGITPATISPESDGIKGITRPQYMTAQWDKKGAFVLTSYAGNPSATDPSMLRYTYTEGTIGAVETDNAAAFKNAYATAFNKDYTIFAAHERVGTATDNNYSRIHIYSVAYDATTGKPTFTEKYSFEVEGANVTDMAFDFANNIYITNRSKEYVAVWQLPSDIAKAKQTTPSMSSQNYYVAGTPTISSATPKWTADGNGQTVTLNWTASGKPEGFNVYCNGEKVATVTTTSCKTAMPMFNAGETVTLPQFTVTAFGNGLESAQSAPVEVKYAEFDAPEAVAAYTIRGAEKALTVTWDEPDYANVTKFLVRRYSSATSFKSYIQVAELSGDTYRFTDKKTSSDSTYLYTVVAYFDKQLITENNATSHKTKASAKTDKVTIPTKEYNPPVITSLENYPGRNKVGIHWERGGNPQYYMIYRDGILVADTHDGQSFIDQLVPDGTPTYTVVAVYTDPAVRVYSEPMQLDGVIDRDLAVTQYGLEEIYDYPILSQAEATAQGYTTKNAFITDRKNSPVANMHMAESEYGGTRGGLYRQAAYRWGHWYISQLHSSTTVTGTLANGTDIASWGSATAADKGGVIQIDEANLTTALPVKVLENNTATNQILAMDNSGNAKSPNVSFLIRHSTGTGNFYGLNQSASMWHLTASSNTWSEKVIDGITNHYDTSKSDQTGRVHYATADGKIYSGTSGGRVFYALNKLNQVQVMTFNNGVLQEDRTYTIKHKDLTTDNAYTSCTENYAFPIEGRNDFIAEFRSNGYYYVNAETGAATKILDKTESANAGGLTFTYNGELFFIHPSAFHSNNVGHFLINLVKRTGEQSIAEADFTQLIPVAAYSQDDYTQEKAANTNGQWYGYDENPEDGSLNIYLYVPGVRFAKYRFFSYDNYPPVEPKLNVDIRHNEEGTDITHLNAAITWERPEKYAHSGEYNNYRIKEYRVALYDDDMKLVKEWTVADTENKVYSIDYCTNERGRYHLSEQNYTVQVTPVYVSTADSKHIVVGETNADDDIAEFAANIESITAKSYYNPSQNVYRVEFDVEPADKFEYPEPVSHFAIEQSTDGGENFTAVPYLWLYMNGGQLHASVGDDHDGEFPTHDNKLPGTYRFHNEGNVLPNSTEDVVAGTDKGVFEGREQVGYFYTTEAPDQDVIYRATARYANGNPYLAKDATATATVVDGGLTGVESVSTDNVHGTVNVYPVPAQSTVTVESAQPINSLRVFSATGALTGSYKGNGTLTHTIDVSTLTAGTYIVVVNDSTPVRMVKN